MGVEALFLIFLVLKLVGVIGWSWWWVTAPLWAAALLDCILIVGLLKAVGSITTHPKARLA